MNICEFSKWSRAKDGHKSICKNCISEKRRTDRISKGLSVRIDRSEETVATKVCTKCLKLLDRSKFSGRNSWCNECRAKDNRIRLGASEKPV